MRDNVADTESIDIQKNELNWITNALSSSKEVFIFGYHGAGKSSLIRRFSTLRQPITSIYCKNKNLDQLANEISEIDPEKTLFLDSVTHLYEPCRLISSQRLAPTIYGIHIQPSTHNFLFDQDSKKSALVVGVLTASDAYKLLEVTHPQLCPSVSKQISKFAGFRRRDILLLADYAIKNGEISADSISEIAFEKRTYFKHIFDEHLSLSEKVYITSLITESSNQFPFPSNHLISGGLCSRKNDCYKINGEYLHAGFSFVCK